MDENVIIIQVVESDKSDEIIREATEVLNRYFGGTKKIIPAIVKLPH